MKKFLSLLLAMSMILSIAVVSMAADPTTAAELKTAVESASAGDVINVTSAITISSDITLNPSVAVTINTGRNVDYIKVVSGGKLTLGANVTVSGDSETILVNGGELVVNGATIKGKNYDDECVLGMVSGTININSGLVTTDGSLTSSVASAIGMLGGTLNINGGTVSSTSSGLGSAAFAYGGTINVYGGVVTNGNQDPVLSTALIAAGSTAVVNVYDGDVDSVLAHANANSTVNIEGGSIGAVCAKNGASIEISGGNVTGNVVANGGSITVSGGIFTEDVTEFLAPGVEQTGGAVVPAGGTSINPIGGATKPVKGNGLANDNLYTYTKAGGFDAVNTDTVTFGTKLYVLLTDASGNAVKADAVKGLSVSDKWTQNGSYVGKVEIVKVGGHYAIVIPTEGSSLEEVQILGNIAVKGKSLYVDNQGKSQKADVKFDFDVELGLAWTEEDASYGMDVTDKILYDFEGIDEEDFALSFGPFDVEVDTKGMKKVLMSYNDEENDDIVDANPAADLEFVNCEAAFRRTATVTVALENGYFLYEIVDGKLVEVNGEYDEWTEEFTFKTRRLGSYVISDVELKIAEVVVVNPSTGAAA